MQKTLVRQVEIRASARRVFDTLSDPKTLFMGMPLIDKIKIVSTPDGPMRKGTRIRASVRRVQGGAPIEGELEVTAFMPPRVIEFAGFLSLKRPRGRSVSRYEIEQYGSISKLIVTTRIEPDIWFLRFVWPLTRMVFGWLGAWHLKQVKAAAEKS